MVSNIKDYFFVFVTSVELTSFELMCVAVEHQDLGNHVDLLVYHGEGVPFLQVVRTVPIFF